MNNKTKFDRFSSEMKPLPKGEYELTNATYHKDPYGSGWTFYIEGTIDTANYLLEDIILVEKVKLQDLKNENDQCLLEIERLTKLVDELQGKNDQLEVKNKNQAKILNRDGFGYSKKYYDNKIQNLDKYIVSK
jgi:hypothetical protein